MKLKKSISMLLVTTILSLSVVGCGSTEDSTSDDKTLTIWSHLTPDEVKEVDKVA